MVKIVTAFLSAETSRKIKEILLSAEMRVFNECDSGSQILRTISDYEEGIIICGYSLSDMNALTLRQYLPSKYIVLVIATKQYEYLADTNGIFYVSAPLNKMELISSVKMIGQFKKKMQDYQKEIDDLGSNLERVKLTERAKGYLMDKYNMSEPEAHKYMQKRSMDTGMKITQISKLILEEQ